MNADDVASRLMTDLATVPNEDVALVRSELRRLRALWPGAWAGVPRVVRARRVVPAEMRCQCPDREPCSCSR